MGKAQRAKDKKATEQLGNPEVFAKKSGSSGKATKIALAAIALIIAVILVFSFIQSSGILLRSDYGFKSENFEIDGAMMQYLYHTQIYSFLDTYYYYIYYYQNMGMTIVDFSKPLEDQTFSANAKALFGDYDGTWFEFFWDTTVTNAKQILTLCEAAKAEGVLEKYEAEAKVLVDAEVESYKEATKENFPSVNAYIEYLYGDGVNTSDVKKIQTLSTIASLYYQDKSDEFLEGLTDEQILKFHDENKSDYLKADYIVASFSASLGSKPTDAEKVEFQKEIEEIKAHAEAVSKLDSVEKINEYMAGYWFDESFQTTFDKAFTTDKVDKTKIPTGETLEKIKGEIKKIVLEKGLAETYDSATDKTFFSTEDYPDIAKTLNTVTVTFITTTRSSLESIKVKEEAYAESTDKDKWLFNSETKVGDVGVFYGTEESKEDKFNKETGTSYVVNVFRVEKTAYRIETPSVQFGHILLTSQGEYNTETKQKEKLIALKEEFLKGEVTKERFEKLAEDLTEDSKVVYEDTCPGDMVEEMNDWLFDEARKAGDTEIIKTTYGYHLTYYIGQGKETWYVNTKADLHADTVDKWYKGIEESIKDKIQENTKITDKIEGANALLNY